MDAEDTGGGVIFKDFLFLTTLAFLVIVIMLLAHINPPAKRAEDAPPPGQLTVEIHWPNENPADVDLWVQAPNDVPVGYSNKGGRVFNLLRDDLGRTADYLELNYENAYTRGIPAGEYTVNLHLYRSAGILPVPVKVLVSVRASTGLMSQILATEVQLVASGQELTVLRFKISDKGGLVPGSVHSIPKSLRAMRAAP